MGYSFLLVQECQLVLQRDQGSGLEEAEWSWKTRCKMMKMDPLKAAIFR